MSTLNVSNITDGTDTVGTSYVLNGSAKAWCNWNGQSTVAIRDSLNVSTLTDNGTGNYTTSWSSVFGDSDYSIAVATGSQTTAQNFWDRILGIKEVRANGCDWYSSNNDSDTLIDQPVCSCTHNGELA